MAGEQGFCLREGGNPVVFSLPHRECRPLVSLQNDLIIEMPRKRKQTRRFGGQEMDLDNISDLDSSDSEASEIAEEIGLATRGSKRLKGKAGKHLVLRVICACL